MNDLYAAAAEAENHYHTQAENLGASKDHADRVLRQAVFDAGRAGNGNPYELAYLQLVADLNRNPE